MKYRVSGWREMFGAFEQALHRARELRKRLGVDFSVIEIDDDGNETPITYVATERTKLRDDANAL